MFEKGGIKHEQQEIGEEFLAGGKKSAHGEGSQVHRRCKIGKKRAQRGSTHWGGTVFIGGTGAYKPKVKATRERNAGRLCSRGSPEERKRKAIDGSSFKVQEKEKERGVLH